MTIIALKIVSAMEISEVMPSFTYKWAEENPEDFKDILYRFGMNVNMGFETQKDVTANNGRFGPYVAHDANYRSIKAPLDVYTITLSQALELLAQEKKPRGFQKKQK